MSEDKQEKLIDLLLKKAVSGLDVTEQRELDSSKRSAFSVFF